MASSIDIDLAAVNFALQNRLGDKLPSYLSLIHNWFRGKVSKVKLDQMAVQFLGPDIFLHTQLVLGLLDQCHQAQGQKNTFRQEEEIAVRFPVSKREVEDLTKELQEQQRRKKEVDFAEEDARTGTVKYMKNLKCEKEIAEYCEEHPGEMVDYRDFLQALEKKPMDGKKLFYEARFKPCDPIDLLMSDNSLSLSRREATMAHQFRCHFAVQERCLLDPYLIHGRVLTLAYMRGIYEVDSNVADIVTVAVKRALKNLLEKIVRSRKPLFAVPGYQEEFGAPALPFGDPFLQVDPLRRLVDPLEEEEEDELEEEEEGIEEEDEFFNGSQEVEEEDHHEPEMDLDDPSLTVEFPKTPEEITELAEEPVDEESHEVEEDYVAMAPDYQSMEYSHGVGMDSMLTPENSPNIPGNVNQVYSPPVFLDDPMNHAMVNMDHSAMPMVPRNGMNHLQLVQYEQVVLENSDGSLFMVQVPTMVEDLPPTPPDDGLLMLAQPEQQLAPQPDDCDPLLGPTVPLEPSVGGKPDEKKEKQEEEEVDEGPPVPPPEQMSEELRVELMKEAASAYLPAYNPGKITTWDLFHTLQNNPEVLPSNRIRAKAAFGCAMEMSHVPWLPE